jgi:acid phosphatase
MSTRSYSDVIGSPNAPFVNLLARSGATFLDAQAVARPAAPNYFALFAGSTYGIDGDSCPHRFGGPNLATQLRASHLTFASFTEGLPKGGSRKCSLDPYTTSHNAPVAFSNVPASMLRRANAFGTDFASLPTVSFVIPDRNDSMALDLRAGDTWLRTELAGYAAWATSHRSLLVVTWDQARRTDPDNHIPMIALGTDVTVGLDAQHIDHYALLATIEDGLGLSRLGNTVGIAPIAALGT